jgi:hypothetical protein
LRCTVWIVLGTLLALGAASCSSAGVGVSHLAAKSPVTLPTPPTPPTIGSGTPTSPVTAPALVTPSTETNVYPNPYDPGYSTIDQLVPDSTFIVMGTLEAASPGVDMNGNIRMSYPISVQYSFEAIPRNTLTVLQSEVTAANLTVGSTYIFFWAAGTNTVCIVGGVRGVMAYDAATNTVTRLDNSSSSQIPQSQSLDQFANAVKNAIPIGVQPMSTDAPPVCSPSATGLPGS